MISRNMTNRMRAAAIAAIMCLSAAAATAPALVQTASISASAAVAINKALPETKGSNVYEGYTAELASSDAKTITFTLKADYTGNFSYGFGIGTASDPYWYEWDGKSWVDTKGGTVEVPGISVPVTEGQEFTITIDTSSLDLKYDPASAQYPGTYQLRNYYSNGTGTITVVSAAANDTSTPASTETQPSSENQTTTEPATGGSSSSGTAAGTVLSDDTKSADSKYRGYTADLASSGIKNITITLDTGDYAGNLSYGFGIGTADAPYWYEWDGKSWVDTSDGKEVAGTNVTSSGGEVVIVIDTSKLDLKYDPASAEYPGEFEFRNYYSGGSSVTVKSIVANGTAEATPSDPSEPNTEDEHKLSIKDGQTSVNRTSGTWSFTDNGDGTGTMTATQARQIEFDKALTLTRGFDEEYYAEQGISPVEGTDPINSHKFSYNDFGLGGIGANGTVAIESIMATIQSKQDVKSFMYGGGLNVENESPADTESAKRKAGAAATENAGYWYNDMGEEKIEEYEAAGVEFGITPGYGYFLSNEDNQLGTYFSVIWDVPEAVKPYETSGEISFQYWYGVENTEEDYVEVDAVDLLGGVLTYTETQTFKCNSTKKVDVNKEIKAGDMSGEISFADDLGLTANDDVKAVVFTVSAGQDLDKLVYGVGASVGEDWKLWSPEEEAWDYVITNTASGDVEIAWMLPSALDINEEYGNLQFGYWYGGKGESELASVTLKSVEVFYYEEETPTEPEKPAVTLYGDVNVDGEVDIMDVILLNKAIFGKTELSAQGTVNADVDENNVPDSTDCLNIMKLIIKLMTPEEFPIKK